MNESPPIIEEAADKLRVRERQYRFIMKAVVLVAGFLLIVSVVLSVFGLRGLNDVSKNNRQLIEDVQSVGESTRLLTERVVAQHACIERLLFIPAAERVLFTPAQFKEICPTETLGAR